MTADVNVTEKVAEAWEQHDAVWLGDWPNGKTCPTCGPFDGESAAAHRTRFALAALSDPEVLEGMAEVLREHDAPTHIDGLPDDEYDCCAVAVVKRLRGQG